MKAVKSLVLVLLLLVPLSLITASRLSPPVFGGKSTPKSPHFVEEVTFTLGSPLTASGKAAGLGNLPTGGFLSASEVLVTYVCINSGGNIAAGQPLVFQNQVGPFVSLFVRNGNIDFTISMNPPPNPDPSIVCPNGNWTVEPTLFTYFNVLLHIQQDGVDVLIASGGTISGL